MKRLEDDATIARTSTQDAVAEVSGSSAGPAIGTVGADEQITVESRRQHRASVRKSIRQNAEFTLPFLVMNTLATIVACYGLLEDSTAVVIGAMIIAMLLGPLTGIALALVDGDTELLRKALVAEFGGAAVVLCVSLLIGLVHRDIPITHEILSRTSPNLLDLMIALAGGAAGAYATVSPRLSVGLVGVAIATALVPPLATCGICLARNEPALAWGGFLLFFTNFIAIQFASSVVMWLNGFHDVTVTGATARKRREKIVVTNSVSLVVLLLLTFVMATNFISSLTTETFQESMREQLKARFAAFPGVRLADVTFRRTDDAVSVIAVVRSPYSFSPQRVRELEQGLPTMAGKRIDLEVMSVLVKEANRDRYLNETAGKVKAAVAGAKQTVETPGTALSSAEPTTTTDTKVFGP